MVNFVNEGTRPTTRDARKINFWVVHVVTQVVSIGTCRSVLAYSVMAYAW